MALELKGIRLTTIHDHQCARCAFVNIFFVYKNIFLVFVLNTESKNVILFQRNNSTYFQLKVENFYKNESSQK